MYPKYLQEKKATQSCEFEPSIHYSLWDKKPINVHAFKEADMPKSHPVLCQAVVGYEK